MPLEEDIAVDAAERFGVVPVRPRASDVAAIILLLVGGLVLPIIGWFIGAALLWASAVFTTRDKLIGTFVLPGGLGLPAVLLFMPVTSDACVVEGGSVGVEVGTCPAESLLGGVAGAILLALAVLTPLATALYLSRKLSNSRIAEDNQPKVP